MQRRLGDPRLPGLGVLGSPHPAPPTASRKRPEHTLGLL